MKISEEEIVRIVEKACDELNVIVRDTIDGALEPEKAKMRIESFEKYGAAVSAKVHAGLLNR